MKLQQVERNGIERSANRRRRRIDEQADDGDERRNASRDGSRLIEADAARRPDQKTSPIASAPARAAATASSTRVMPQILTRVRMSGIVSSAGMRSGAHVAGKLKRTG